MATTRPEAEPRKPTRVFVIDPQSLTREGLIAVMSSERDIEVAGYADSTHMAFLNSASFESDIFLVDVLLPDEDGIEAIRAIKTRCPRAQVLVVTMRADLDLFRSAAEAGAVGYVLKDIPPRHLVSAIRAIRDGATMINPQLTRQIVEDLATGNGTRTTTRRRGPNGMTNREIQILAEVARGLTDKEIATRQHLAECTVKHYLQAMYERFRLRNRAHAAAFAVHKGLVDKS